MTAFADRIHLERWIGILPVLAFVGLWQTVAVLGHVPPTLLPRPAAVFGRLGVQLLDTGFLSNVATTLFRLFCGFAIAAVLGIAIGLAAAANRVVGAVVTPLVRILAPVPKIALYPALILTLGFDHASKIALVAADALFPILLATYQGAAQVEPKLIWSARAAGAASRQVLFGVMLPAALPSILTGCRIGLVIACIVVFLAEMITSTEGLGSLLVRAARSFQTVDMFVPLIAISLVGLILNGVFNLARARLLRGFPEDG